jgi:hypothetical protein
MDFDFKSWINEKVLDYLPKNSIRSGDKINCRCPICGDSKKNAMKKRGYYYLSTSSYHCFNCETTLTGMKLLEHLCGSDYSEIKNEYLQNMYDGRHFSTLTKSFKKEKINKPLMFSLKNIVKSEWKKPLSEKAIEYLSKRKVLDAPFLKEKLYTYYTKKGDEYILIPWKLNGVECYFQLNDFERHNNMGLKYIFPKNKDKMIYGLDNIDLSKNYIIVFEGVYDSLFVPNSICVGGKTVTDNQLNIIRKRYPNMKIYLSFDNDKPGIDALNKSFYDKRYDFGYFKWFNKNTKEKDINDFIINKGDVNYFTKNIDNMLIDKVIMKLNMMRSI